MSRATFFAASLLVFAAVLLSPAFNTAPRPDNAWNTTGTYTATLDTVEDWQRGRFTRTLALNDQLQLVEHPGTSLWKTRFNQSGQAVTTDPGSGDVYFLTANGYLRRLTAETGAVKDVFPRRFRFGRDLAVNRETGDLYIAAGSGVLAVDAATGKPAWSVTAIPHSIAYNPATNQVYIASAQQQFKALTADTGDTAWVQDNATAWMEDVAVGSGGAAVYTSTNNGFFYRLFPGNGSIQWRQQTPGGGDVEQVAADRHGVYAATGKQVHAYTPAGVPRWNTTLRETITAVATANNRVYIGTKTGRIHVFHGETGNRAWQRQAHTGAVRGLGFSPAKSFLYTAGQDGALQKLFAVTADTGGYTHRFIPPIDDAEKVVYWRNVTVEGESLHGVTVTATFSNTTDFMDGKTVNLSVPQNGVISLQHRSQYLELSFTLEKTRGKSPRINRVTVRGPVQHATSRGR